MGIFDSIGSILEGFGEFLPVVSAGAQLLGGASSRQNAMNNAADIARIGEREARQTLIAGSINANQIALEGQKVAGLAQARVGASGFQLRGSTLDLVASNYANAEINRLNTLYNARREADLVRERARATATVTRAEGNVSLTRSIGGAAATLAGSGIFSKTEGIDDGGITRG